jgi:ABC-2 type transport system ATP-binding protein
MEIAMQLQIDGLTRTYRSRLGRRPGIRANDGVSLSVNAGQVYGLLGHNGAGKTTLVNQVVGLVRPDAGTIHIAGRDAIADPGFARRVCSLQPQAQLPLDGLTPRQAIELVGRLRSGRAADVRARRDDLAAALDIGEWMDTDGARLSGGVKRLVSFAMAAVVPGLVVVLDEPTNDVDPVRRRLLWDQVRHLAAEGSAVLLVTHNVLEAERSVDRLSILNDGRVIAEGTPGELKAGLAADLRLELVLEPGMTTPSPAPFVVRYAPGGARVVATIPADRAGAAVAWADGLRRSGAIEEYSLTAATLEDVYVEIVAAAGDPRNMEVHDDRAA